MGNVCQRERDSACRAPRVQSEGFELLAPFGWGVAKSLDSNAAGQTTFDRSAHHAEKLSYKKRR
jgi:hypothetical protein